MALLASLLIVPCDIAIGRQQLLENQQQALSSDHNQVINHSDLQVISQQPVAGEAEYAQKFLNKYNISAEMIAAGQLTAVDKNSSDVITNNNFKDVLVPGTILVDQVRTEARLMRAPESLMTIQPSARTYALSWEVVTSEGRFGAWGRDSTGLNYDGSDSAFSGEFDVALVRKSSPEDRSTLSDPISISISAPGARKIEPRPLAITRLREWHAVAISVPHVVPNSYEVAVSADPADDGDRIELQVFRPSVTFTATPESIVGWGIGKTKIGVQVKGLRNPNGYEIRLSSTNGTLTSGSVNLNAQGNGEVWLRSSRHNGTSVSVADSAFVGTPKNILFEAPWLFLALAVLGGLVGAYLKGRGRKHWLKALTVGAVTGVVMVLMYFVGINWIAPSFPDADLARGGEAVVFVLGVLGALLGVSKALPKEK